MSNCLQDLPIVSYNLGQTPLPPELLFSLDFVIHEGGVITDLLGSSQGANETAQGAVSPLAKAAVMTQAQLT